MTTVLFENRMVQSSPKPLVSHQKPRILFLAPFAPNLQAGHGGGRVIAQLITHLSQRHAIGLCYLRSAMEPAADEVVRDSCEVVEEVVLPEMSASGMKRWFHRFHVWKTLIAGKPLWAIDRFSAAYEQRLLNLLETWQPDIVQIEFHVMGQYLPALINYPAPKILIQHEPGAEAARVSIGSPFSKGYIIPHVDLFAWERFERRITRQVDTVVAFTARDRKAVRELGQKTPIVQIPLGTEIPDSAPDEVTQDPLSLLFIGNFKHLPNVDAAERLINHIFPKVQNQIPEAHLILVGDHLPAHILQNENKNVIMTGYVPDIAPYLNRAALVVVPLRFGGGMRVKILEALAAGKAVVASTLAVEGLEVANEQQVILAEDDEEFAGAIIDLLRHPEKRLNLAFQAREWATANLSWVRVAEVYGLLYRCLLKY